MPDRFTSTAYSRLNLLHYTFVYIKSAEMFLRTTHTMAFICVLNVTMSPSFVSLSLRKFIFFENRSHNVNVDELSLDEQSANSIVQCVTINCLWMPEITSDEGTHITHKHTKNDNMKNKKAQTIRFIIIGSIARIRNRRATIIIMFETTTTPHQN